MIILIKRKMTLMVIIHNGIIQSLNKKKSIANLASRRPIQREKETLDIEPLDDKKFISENQKVESVEIDDPW